MSFENKSFGAAESPAEKIKKVDVTSELGKLDRQYGGVESAVKKLEAEFGEKQGKSAETIKQETRDDRAFDTLLEMYELMKEGVEGGSKKFSVADYSELEDYQKKVEEAGHLRYGKGVRPTRPFGINADDILKLRKAEKKKARGY